MILMAVPVHKRGPVGGIFFYPKVMIGDLLTALAAAGYAGLLFFPGADGIRRGYGFWLLFGRFILFKYGYKLFDILAQDQYVVITRKYYVKSYTETRGCKSWDDRGFNAKNQMIRLTIPLPAISC